MYKDRITYLLNRWLQQQCTADELSELTVFLSDDKNKDLFVETGTAVFGETGESPVFNDRLLPMLEKIIQVDRPVMSVPVVQHQPMLERWMAIAAAAVLLLAIASTWLFQEHNAATSTAGRQQYSDLLPGSDKAMLTIGHGKPILLTAGKTGIAVGNSITYNDGEKIADTGQLLTLSVPKGGKYQVTLPDGTQVWLNAATSLTFPSRFNTLERVVSLSGEAYFEVAADKSKPFNLIANRQRVKVLGTSFNVNAYTDEPVEVTTLVRGSVSVAQEFSGNGRAVTLLPGQQAGSALNMPLQVTVADVDRTLAWKNGVFSFKNADLPTIMRQLARWYNLEVIFKAGVSTDKFSGKIDRGLTLQQVLKGLRITRVNYTLEGRRLILQP